jgi:hypothetical protein
MILKMKSQKICQSYLLIYNENENKRRRKCEENINDCQLISPSSAHRKQKALGVERETWLAHRRLAGRKWHAESSYQQRAFKYLS